MKLFFVVFSTVNPYGAEVRSYLEAASMPSSKHFRSDGFSVVKETNNRWILETYPEGMPRQYRKADEYRVLNNNSGIYMFGRDPEKLISAWNSAAAA